jgi:hypothetical protein
MFLWTDVNVDEKIGRALEGDHVSKRESKSTAQTTIQVIGRNADVKGTLQFTSGHLNFWRKSAKGLSTLSLTMQELIAVLEKKAAYDALEPGALVFPKPHPDGDLSLNVTEWERSLDEAIPLFGAHHTTKKLIRGGMEQGRYQLTSEPMKGTRRTQYPWVLNVSVQCALWVVDFYIDQVLEKRRLDTTIDSVAVISKEKLKSVLNTWLKRLEGPVTPARS